ncbi:MAG: 8-oxoguanine DNA glycosylase OGG fold protein [Planctomycetota bacterium]
MAVDDISIQIVNIPPEYHEAIRRINVNLTRVQPDYGRWTKAFSRRLTIKKKIEHLENVLGYQFNRADLVKLYSKHRDTDIVLCFLATMIWGHEPAPSKSPGGRLFRDNRGPKKVVKMFSESKNIQRSLQAVSVGTPDEITASYKLLDKGIKYCGPSFFTKHFYFLGKSLNREKYPLIYDNRVATVLIRLQVSTYSHLELVSIKALTKPKAYLAYLKYAGRQKKIIKCPLDKIEYFLFDHMNRRD